MAERRGCIAFGLALSGCVVGAPEVVDQGFFACAEAAECGPGQGCAEGNVYSSDFCRPACDLDDPSTCPGGVCTATGACLESCVLSADGTARGCDSPEFTCVRTDAIRDVGVCFPVDGCSRSGDCDEDASQLCLNDALGLPVTTQGARFDNLYCTARPDDEGRCAEGYLRFQFAQPEGGVIEVCYPPCNPDHGAPYCPPATTCFRGYGELAGSPTMPPCLPGLWGLPCEDDTQCLLGRCLPVGDGRRACTETCQDATDLAGGCDELARVSRSLGVGTAMSCENDVCVPRYELLALCDDNLECVGGEETQCTPIQAGRDTILHVCVRLCITERDCVTGAGGRARDYRCIEAGGLGGVCMVKRGLGDRCSEDADCNVGSCCDLGEFSACQRSC